MELACLSLTRRVKVLGLRGMLGEVQKETSVKMLRNMNTFDYDDEYDHDDGHDDDH